MANVKFTDLPAAVSVIGTEIAAIVQSATSKSATLQQIANLAPPPSFATWDPSRKGTGTTLSGGNLEASISGLYMVAATNPVDISGSTGYYAEFQVPNTSVFIGFGPLRSDTLTDTYLGAYSNQFCQWQDATTDSGGGITNNGTFSYGSSLPITLMYAVKSNNLYYGRVGTGWYNPASGLFNGDPTTGTGICLTGFAAGLWSLGVSSVSGATAHCTANFGASAFSGTPPSGFVGWPG